MIGHEMACSEPVTVRLPAAAMLWYAVTRFLRGWMPRHEWIGRCGLLMAVRMSRGLDTAVGGIMPDAKLPKRPCLCVPNIYTWLAHGHGLSFTEH